LRPAQVTDEKIKKAKALNELARKRGQSLAQFALAWVLRQPQVTSVLIGASSIAQIEENVAALNDLSFSPAELKAIDALAPA
jgi:L-glyceraldehyde 3-phosphate reductase